MWFKLANANKGRDMNIFNERFSTGQVIAATGLPNHTLQSWLKRDLLVSQPEAPIEGGGVPGLHRKFSFHSVMEIAVAKALCDIGLSTANSLKAAVHFAHMGQVITYYEGESPDWAAMRRPSLPFDNRNGGKTLIFVAGEKSGELHWRPGTDILTTAISKFGDGFVMLNASDVFERTTRALDFDPNVVMASAYSHTGEQ